MANPATTTPIPQSASAGSGGLRDIKPPIEIPDPWRFVWWGLAVLAVAAAAFFLWRWLQKRKQVASYVPPIPAHVRARQKLQEALALLGQPREFCIAVSDTIRGYLEERFTFHAPERTTEEFLYELRETDLLTPDQKDGLGEFLKRCDLVKFARYEPREPELRDLHESAVRLVDETEPVETPPGAEPGLNDPDHPPRLTPHDSGNAQYATRDTSRPR